MVTSPIIIHVDCLRDAALRKKWFGWPKGWILSAQFALVAVLLRTITVDTAKKGWFCPLALLFEKIIHTALKAYSDWVACMYSQLLQSCLTLCDPMDCSLSGSSAHGIFLERILVQVATPSSRGIFPTRGLNPHLLCLLHCRQIFYHWATRETRHQFKRKRRCTNWMWSLSWSLTQKKEHSLKNSLRFVLSSTSKSERMLTSFFHKRKR